MRNCLLTIFLLLTYSSTFSEVQELSEKNIYNQATILNHAVGYSIFGSFLYFSGTAMNYSSLAMALAGNEIDYKSLSTLTTTSFILQLIGVPISCFQATKAENLCEFNSYSERPKQHAWFFYKAGWVLDITGEIIAIIGIVNMNGSKENYNKGLIEAIIGVSLIIGRDISWSTSCISSMIYTSKVKKILSSQKTSLLLTPYYYQPDRAFGLQLKYYF